MTDFTNISLSTWENNCGLGIDFYGLLVDIVVAQNEVDLLSFDQLDKTLVCKADCDFSDLLNRTSVFSQDRTKFAFHVAGKLNEDAGSNCANIFPELESAFSNFTSSDILNNTSKLFLISLT